MRKLLRIIDAFIDCIRIILDPENRTIQPSAPAFERGRVSVAPVKAAIREAASQLLQFPARGDMRGQKNAGKIALDRNKGTEYGWDLIAML